MAKQTLQAEPIQATEIASPFFSGLLSEMPQEAKDKMKAEKPEAYKMVFGETEPETETVQE